MKDTHSEMPSSDQAQLRTIPNRNPNTHTRAHAHFVWQLDLEPARNQSRILRKKLYYYNQVYDCNSAALLECQ